MKKSSHLTKLGLSIFLLTSLLVLPCSPAVAFDPTHILSDAEMQDYQSMTKTDVQNFLEFQGGKIAKMSVVDDTGKKKKVSSVIYDTAKKYMINPKYILVTLQKEQSLLTAKNPTQKQLDWAAGYAICDSCSMNDPSLQSHRGLFNQIDSAAGLIRWYYDNVTNTKWIKRPQSTYNIDGLLVQPQSYATAFLYTYTPHIHGNQIFYTLWKKWFEQTYPGGTLLKSASTNIVYLIQNGKKRPIASSGVLVSRFDPKSVIIATESELGRYDTGSEIRFPNYSILKNENNYYLLDYDILRPFASTEVVRRIGYNPDEIIEISADDIRDYDIGSVINTDTSDVTGRLIRFENRKTYFAKNNTLFPIKHSIISAKNFPQLKLERVNSTDFANYTIGESLTLPDGTLFAMKGDKNIYVVDAGAKRLIPDETTFKNLGYSFNSVVYVPAIVANMHRKGLPMSTTHLADEPKKDSNTKNTINSEKKETLVLKITEGRMATVPTKAITYEGGAKFTTKTDTYIIADYETGQVLAAKNADAVRPLASFTKVLAAKVMFENSIDLNQVTTYNTATMKSQYKDLRIVAGEKIINKDLMNSFLVSSINSAGPMLAMSVADSETDFVKKMNEAVTALGLINTKFTDSYGYDLGNIGTAREFLAIFRDSLLNPQILKYLSTKNYTFDETLDLDGAKTHFDNNTNLLLRKKDLPYKILASKTGFLNESGANLAMAISRPKDGKKFIIITMGNPDYPNRFNDPDSLARWTIKTF